MKVQCMSQRGVLFYSSSSYRGCIVCLLLDCRFCAHLKASENTQIFAPFLLEIRDGLFAMAALSTDDVLASVSEALGNVLWVSVVLCLSRNERSGKRIVWVIRDVQQARIHTGSHRLTEIGQSFRSKYLSDFVQTCPLGFRLAPDAGRSPSGVQKSRGLAVLVGTAGQPRNCPNSGWVDQALGSKLVGQGGGCFDTTPSVGCGVHQRL